MMNEKNEKLNKYLSSLSPEDREKLERLMRRLDEHLSLGRRESAAFREDYDRAVMYYLVNGVSIDEAVRRLDPTVLGGFYSREGSVWYALDSSAKIYPLSMSMTKMAVFRLSAYLKADVVPELLQIALSDVMPRFPYFAVTVKRGFFWHYLDALVTRYPVKEEDGIVCEPISLASNTPALRVVYYRNRISVEFFHILTDGNGGLIFLKTLVARYLTLLGEEIPAEDGVFDLGAIPDPEEGENAFLRYRDKSGGGGLVDAPARQLGGRLSRVRPCRIIHFEMDSAKLSTLAKENGATVTALVSALIFIASRAAMDGGEGNIQVQIPANMRKHFPSKTMRNFALYATLRMPVEDDYSFENVLRNMHDCLTSGLERKNLMKQMNAAASLVHNLRFVPLSIKIPVAQVIYGFLGERIFTNTLSNLGVVKMPESMQKHIEKFDFVIGSVSTNRAACGLVTVGDKAVLSIAKNTVDPSFEERLYREFTARGIEVKLTGGELYGD